MTTETRLGVVLLACFAIFSVICILRTPSVSFDANIGLVTWQSMAKGSAFNHLRMASRHNMAADVDDFVAAYSPGQFYLPGVISTLMGIPMGRSLVILQLMVVGLGVAGYYMLYVKTLGFSQTPALVSCFVLLFRRDTLDQFINYSGGTLLMFGAIPYFLMSSWACLKRRGLYLTIVPLIFLAGAFLKLTFTLIALSLIIASIVWRLHNRDRFTRRDLFLQSILDVFTFLVFFGLLYWVYISRGWSAAQPLVSLFWLLFRRETVYQVINYSGGPLKLSFVLIALSFIIASVLWRFRNRSRFGGRYLSLQSAFDIFAFLMVCGLLYWIHIPRGLSFAQPCIGKLLGEATFLFGYSVAAIESGMMSVFWSLAPLGAPLYYLEPRLFHSVPFLWVIVLAALAATSLAIMWAVFVNRSMRQEYRLLWTSLAVVHVAVLTTVFAGGSLIAEDRHFWPVSAVLLPGLLFIIATMRSHWCRLALMVVIAMQMAYSVAAFRMAFDKTSQAGKSRYLAISYPGVPQPVIDAIERLDTNLTSGRNVFFFTEPSLGLLVRRNAILVTTDPATAFETIYASTGKVDRLILVLREDVIRLKTLPVIESRFDGATNWQAASWGSYEIVCSGCDRFGTSSLRARPANE